MKTKNVNFVPIVCFLLFGIAFFFIERNLNKVKVDIERNHTITLAKVFFINSKRSFTDARYFYFYEGRRYESGEYIDSSGDEYLNKYFKVEFSSKNPNHSNIFLDREIRDSSEIRKAGF
ncbi:hypothetical protein [Flavobacterium psychrophilum]|uniref:hypothetical protein n=1 Tax=Flavobacterium psychrophilum TaxID=96345 RepID=UPI000B7C281D|nr:hypothetical protein [Flavobacterium psychrophilum]SNB04678.1 conserved hypothetical protein [Flavobacterium psychrophilum]